MTLPASKKISCSVGILTHNSGKYLRRALESVKDFSDIIVSDGGSTDDTLDIAREYGATIIEQYTKRHPGPNLHHPIEDFARERNILIDAANESWFLWLDSDEYISDELRGEIKDVCAQAEDEFYAYELPLGAQSPDGTVTYKRAKQTYQFRFFNLKTGGRFENEIHERFVFDRDKFPYGRMKGYWYVPIWKSDHKTYSRTVNYRIEKMISSHPPDTFRRYLLMGLWSPLKTTFGTLFRWVETWIKYPIKEAMPFFYYRNRLYSQWVKFRISTLLYIKNLLGKM